MIRQRTISSLRTVDDRQVPLAGGVVVGRKARIDLNVEAVAADRP